MDAAKVEHLLDVKLTHKILSNRPSDDMTQMGNDFESVIKTIGILFVTAIRVIWINFVKQFWSYIYTGPSLKI